MAGLSQIYADGFARDLIPRSTAPTFLSSTSYAVGDYVYYQGNLYRCTTAHTGTWVASHFTAVTVGSELKAKEASLQSEIENVKSDLSDTNERFSFYDSITTIPFEYGGIYQGVETVANNRIRCGYLIGYQNTKISVRGQNAYQVGIQVFNANKEYVATSGWTKEYTLPNDCYYRIQIRKGTSDPEIVDADFAVLLASVDVGYPLVPYVSQLNSTIEEISESASTNKQDISSVEKLLFKGYITQQTETGYAYKNNVAVGSVVDIDTPIAVANIASFVVKNVTEGMRFKVFGTGTYNYLLWSWLDKDRKLISKAGAWESSGSNGLIITAPLNAVYLVCSSTIPYTYGFSAQYMGATIILDNEVSALMTAVDVTKANANLLKNADFNFAFFSDIHGGSTNFQHIIEYAEANNVDSIINGGDTVLNYLNDPNNTFTWYAEGINDSSVDILSAVGNHDVWTGAYWTKANSVDIYNAIIKPLVTKFTNIVQPSSAETEGLCYYYKDYGNVRVIVINAMAGDTSVKFWDTAQSTWLENVLNDSITNDKHVIVCNHSPFPKTIAQRDAKSNWNSWIDYRSYSLSDAIVMETPALDLIKTFINNSGKFICLLTGHEHVDSILTATGYDGQFMLNIASAKYTNHPDGITYTSASSPYYDCFNHCAVDSTHGILKVVRVGWDMDEALKERTVLSYDYFNHRLINE